MATITKRASGKYRAEIILKRGGVIVHRESKSFDQRRLAVDWAKAREVALQAPGALDAVRNRRTVGDLLDWYLREFGADFGRTKLDDIKRLLNFDLAALQAGRLTSQQLIEHVKSRRDSGTGAATVNNDLVWLRIVFKAARPALGLDLNIQAIDDAAVYCRGNKLIAKAAQRSRRPTDAELKILLNYFNNRDKRAEIPMVDIVNFAIYSCRREAEITRLRWEDNDADHHTGIVRDAKHPRMKMGNHREFKYTPEAWAIVEQQPKNGELIFPYNPKSIGATFLNACKACGITDLRFHDLRHHGVSLLFEKGYSIVEVQQFSLHESWATLQRYTHLSPKNVVHR